MLSASLKSWLPDTETSVYQLDIDKMVYLKKKLKQKTPKTSGKAAVKCCLLE